MPYPDAVDALVKSSFRRMVRVENLNGENLRVDGRRSTGHCEWTGISRGFSGKSQRQRDES